LWRKRTRYWRNWGVVVRSAFLWSIATITRMATWLSMWCLMSHCPRASRVACQAVEYTNCNYQRWVALQKRSYRVTEAAMHKLNGICISKTFTFSLLM
jgi:hypothetical protein